MEQNLKVTTSSDDDVFIVLPWVDAILKKKKEKVKKKHVGRAFLHSALHLQSAYNEQQFVVSSRKCLWPQT